MLAPFPLSNPQGVACLVKKAQIHAAQGAPGPVCSLLEKLHFARGPFVESRARQGKACAKQDGDDENQASPLVFHVVSVEGFLV